MAGLRHCIFLVPVSDACNWYVLRFPTIPCNLSKLRANNLSVSNMNYTCVVVGGFLTVELVWWLIAGKRYSATVQRAREEGTSETVVIADGKFDG
jgi:hypothetical protein